MDQQVCLHGVLPQTKHVQRWVVFRSYQAEHGYYLIDYPQTKGFSGGVATINRVIVGVISARYKTENQGTIVPASAVREWLQGIADLRPSLLSTGSTFPPATPITLIPHDAFTHKIRSQIRNLLQGPHMQALHEAIGQRAVENQRKTSWCHPTLPP